MSREAEMNREATQREARQEKDEKPGTRTRRPAEREDVKEPTWKADTPESVKQAWRRFDENRQQHARSLQLWTREVKKDLNFAKQGRIESELSQPYVVDRSGRRPVYYFRSASDKQAFIESAEENVASSEEFHESVAKGSGMFLTERLATDRVPEVGDIGVVNRVWVVNVVDEMTAIVNVNRPTTVTGFSGLAIDRNSIVPMTAEDRRLMAERCDNPVPVWKPLNPSKRQMAATSRRTCLLSSSARRPTRRRSADSEPSCTRRCSASRIGLRLRRNRADGRVATKDA
jgi:hypothetical protein